MLAYSLCDVQLSELSEEKTNNEQKDSLESLIIQQP